MCGRLSVEIDGTQLAGRLRGRQVPVLLAYLLLNRDRPVGREELIGALWPARAPVSADAALRTLLSRLRSALGASALAGRDELLLDLPAPVWIDFEAASEGIERAAEALEQGNAPGAWALAQVPLNIAGRGLLPGAQAAWLEPRRRELDDIRLQALEVIGRAGLRLGRSQLSSVERAARTLIDAEPYRESGYVLLMEALAAAGNVAEALRVYERLRTLLRDELGVTPSRGAVAVHDRLVVPEARPPNPPKTPAHGRRHTDPGPQPARFSIALPPELAARAQAPLIGRADELDRLWRLWAATRDRILSDRPGTRLDPGGRLVVLSGDAGIGKSRLVAELAQRVHGSDGIVLAGRSPEEALLPYQPFVGALRHYVLGIPFAQLRATAREYGSELAPLVPELRRRVPELRAPLEGDPETERYRLFEAVVGLLREMSALAPVLLVLDDLHWADRPTLLLLRHIVRAPDLERVLVLGSYRSTEAQPEGFADALAEFRRERLAIDVPMVGLGPAETAELIRTRAGVLPAPPLGRALHAETEGNPFFIEEMVRHLVEAGVQIDRASPRELARAGLPDGVKLVIARRLSRLGRPAMEWLRAAAVIGREFELSLLEAVVALDEESFLNALDEALAAGLVVESPGTPGSLSFSHALIRETLCEGMSGPRMARLHRRVGEALEAREASGAQAPLTALARHFTRAAGPQDADKAIEYARRAGEQATAMLAHEEAADHYAQALEVQARFRSAAEELRCELLLALGEAWVRAGDRPLAWRTFHEAASIATRRGDSRSLARAAIGASRHYIQPPGVVDEQLIDLLVQARDRTVGTRSVTRVALLTRLCGALSHSPGSSLLRDLADEATELAEDLGKPEARALAAAARRLAQSDPESLDERLADATELLTLGREAGDLELVLQGHAWLVVDLLERGDPDAVDAQIDAFAAGAERLRQPLYLWHAAVWRAMQALLRGQLTQADRLATEALDTGWLSEPVTAQQCYTIQLLALRREQNRIAELERPVRELVHADLHRPAWRAMLATLLWETGRAPEARSEFELLAADGFRNVPRDGDWMIAGTLLADLCADLGDAPRARRLHDLLAPYVAANVVIGPAALCLGSTARYLGRLAATGGEREQAAAYFERALSADAALKAPVCLAHTQLHYARLLGADDPRGRALLAAARQTAERLDLPALALRSRPR